jgi:hypothetical protein
LADARVLSHIGHAGGYESPLREHGRSRLDKLTSASLREAPRRARGFAEPEVDADSIGEAAFVIVLVALPRMGVNVRKG